ncbi:response regulator [Moraxella equi]|uniref:Chemotaxis protein CheY n=1 Tax=Moraxella equi TaxID=60442 RepID=A0A378QVL8_9GAMM|nr:response regulator [Moraxella equi]OPH40028.1 response regulator [Moraxella equi]STZ04492.1 Chemotaxis protein CheY [Moraxella equi]
MYKLMVVDDSNIIRNRIQRAYNNEKFMLVATASNGSDAVEKFKLHQPNVVTMDLTMPHMDGLECIEKLVSLDEDVRILVVSALSDKATGIQALSLGASGFLCKPFSDEELVLALDELMHD